MANPTPKHVGDNVRHTDAHDEIAEGENFTMVMNKMLTALSYAAAVALFATTALADPGHGKGLGLGHDLHHTYHSVFSEYWYTPSCV